VEMRARNSPVKRRDCRFVAVRDIDRKEEKNGDVPVATATPKYYLTLQLSIPEDYPTREFGCEGQLRWP
jgi:hypothetical protein